MAENEKPNNKGLNVSMYTSASECLITIRIKQQKGKPTSTYLDDINAKVKKACNQVDDMQDFLFPVGRQGAGDNG